MNNKHAMSEDGAGRVKVSVPASFFFVTVDSENSWASRKVLENTGIRSGCLLWGFVGKRMVCLSVGVLNHNPFLCTHTELTTGKCLAQLHYCL